MTTSTRNVSAAELAEICDALRGEHMTHPDLAGVTCHGVWPAVDADGNLTGAVAESGTLVDWDHGRLVAHETACEAIRSDA